MICGLLFCLRIKSRSLVAKVAIEVWSRDSRCDDRGARLERREDERELRAERRDEDVGIGAIARSSLEGEDFRLFVCALRCEYADVWFLWLLICAVMSVWAGIAAAMSRISADNNNAILYRTRDFRQ